MSRGDGSADRAQKTTRVPESRAERIGRLGGLLAGIAGDTALEALRRAAGRGETEPLGALLSRANAERLTETLADLRGAAMKLGQMISLQGEDLLPPALAEVLATLQDHASFMPESQVRQVMAAELGADWRSRFRGFDSDPLAAASIGQVHAAVTRDGREVAVKVQYPGVDRSIDADVDALAWVLKVARLLPPEIDVDPLLGEIKAQLAREADYSLEADSMERYARALGNSLDVWVPAVHRDLSAKRVLTTERVFARPIEDLRSPEHTAETRDRVGAALLDLVFRELFEFGFVQTDPNFGNYLYDPRRDRIALLDFGAVREYAPEFSDRYRELVAAAASDSASDEIVSLGRDLGFVPADASAAAREAFVELAQLVGTPLRAAVPFEFAGSDLARRVRDAGVDAYTSRGLDVPPVDVLFLHRKLAGSYLLLSHIGARVDCRAIVEARLGP